MPLIAKQLKNKQANKQTNISVFTFKCIYVRSILLCRNLTDNLQALYVHRFIKISLGINMQRPFEFFPQISQTTQNMKVIQAVPQVLGISFHYDYVALLCTC